MTTHIPFVSVVIPAYNDSDGIALTLESVTNQTYPVDDYEIVVADNGSTDGTRDVVRSYVERYPELVTLVVEDEIQSPAGARNRGIERASGSVLAFLDADMTVDETWLELVVESLLDDGHDYIGYPVKLYAPDGRETITTMADKQFVFTMEKYMEQSQFTVAGCLAIRKAVIDAVGPFDTQLPYGADKEFGKRVYAAGFDQHFESSIVVYHPARTSVAEQLKKSFRMGRGMRRVHETHPDQFSTYSPFRLRSYLPLRPGRFLSQVDGKDELSIRELSKLYVLESTKKFVKYSGSLYEYFVDSSMSRS